MLSLREVMPGGAGSAHRVEGIVTLSFDQRRRSRMLVRLDDGREAAVLLPHGSAVRDGDRLRVDGSDGCVAVRAAAETLSIAHTADPHLLTRAAYHLGNRHVPVVIGAGWLAYEHDHVLDDLVRELGLTVDTRVAPFEPEGGGYRGDGAAGGHRHGAHASGGGHRHHHDG
jgi:urease accessory protein